MKKRISTHELQYLHFNKCNRFASTFFLKDFQSESFPQQHLGKFCLPWKIAWRLFFSPRPPSRLCYKAAGGPAVNLWIVNTGKINFYTLQLKLNEWMLHLSRVDVFYDTSDSNQLHRTWQKPFQTSPLWAFSRSELLFFLIDSSINGQVVIINLQG